MDTKKQKSILDVVNNIVNHNLSEETENISTKIINSILLFEQTFAVNLKEEEINTLLDLTFNHLEKPYEIEPVDLNENTEIIIEKFTPEQVYLYIFENVGGAAGAAAAAARAAQLAAKKVADLTVKSDDDDEDEDDPLSERQKDTVDPYGYYGAQINMQQQMAGADPASLYYGGYVSEEKSLTLSSKKHKKKVFKITFMDKGVKKRGTAVSHKGVMRIVSGKSTFKVYDENNRDVTTQFKSK